MWCGSGAGGFVLSTAVNALMLDGGRVTGKRDVCASVLLLNYQPLCVKCLSFDPVRGFARSQMFLLHHTHIISITALVSVTHIDAQTSRAIVQMRSSSFFVWTFQPGGEGTDGVLSYPSPTRKVVEREENSTAPACASVLCSTSATGELSYCPGRSFRWFPFPFLRSLLRVRAVHKRWRTWP